MNRFDMLPVEVQSIILRHRAATTLQGTARARLTRTRYAHTRHPHWPTLKDRLRRLGVLCDVYCFPMVRKEWRQELESWLCLTDAELHHVCEEILAHPPRLWGAPDFYFTHYTK